MPPKGVQKSTPAVAAGVSAGQRAAVGLKQRSEGVVQGPLIDDRAADGGVRGGIADRQGAHVINQQVAEAVIGRLLDDDPAGSGALLPGVSHRGRGNGGDRAVQVGVGEHDGGLAAAHLCLAADRPGGCLPDQLESASSRSSRAARRRRA